MDVPLFAIKPLGDPRWSRFLESHPGASVFHSVEWLSALRSTYGYEAIALTTSKPGEEVRSAVVCCYVESWLTGRRLVSIPFADHAALLTNDPADQAAILSALGERMRQEKLHYVELRPVGPLQEAPAPHSTYSYCWHQVDLKPDLDMLLHQCHKDSIQRKIRRAEREGLIYQEGRSAYLLNCFYRLMVLTRRRHLLPPQPKKWFEYLMESFGQALKIRVAFQNDQSIAAILTLRYKDQLLYKYGCSDARFHALGGVQLLLWSALREAKQEGLRVFDLGRSDWEDQGLITFKDRWGSRRSSLTYVRLLPSGQSRAGFRPPSAGWAAHAVEKVIPYLPDCILTTAGDLLYRHMG